MKKILKAVLGKHLSDKALFLKYRYFSSGEGIKELDREKFYAQFVKPGDLCFDIGANMGNRIHPLLNIGARVVAAEPQEVCQKVLKAKFGERIELVPFGLGAQEAEKNFYKSDLHVLSSFSTDWISSVSEERFKDNKWFAPVKMQMTTLDKLTEKFGIPNFVKIDVEGYELEVLKGLTQPIKVISFEYTVPEQIDKVIQCLDQIERYNASIECNYSVGESMLLALNEWQSPRTFKEYIESPEFITTTFGDIYVRTL